MLSVRPTSGEAADSVKITSMLDTSHGLPELWSRSNLVLTVNQSKMDSGIPYHRPFAALQTAQLLK
jgi:hypothetical protein